MNTARVALLIGLILLTSSAVAGTFTFTPLDDPLGYYTHAYGVDGSSIVGEFLATAGGDYGYLCTGSTYATIAN